MAYVPFPKQPRSFAAVCQRFDGGFNDGVWNCSSRREEALILVCPFEGERFEPPHGGSYTPPALPAEYERFVSGVASHKLLPQVLDVVRAAGRLARRPLHQLLRPRAFALAVNFLAQPGEK